MEGLIMAIVVVMARWSLVYGLSGPSTDSHSDENYFMMTTEVSKIKLDPQLFNWSHENPDLFAYQASLFGGPDLPTWLSYIHSPRQRCAYLYGVPPASEQAKYVIEVVALNRRNYETRTKRVIIHVADKLLPAHNEVHMKIDNLNVDDVLEHEKIETLLGVFRNTLWTNGGDVYVTFLESAVKMGARRPANPREGEGVVLRLGSQANISGDLYNLEKEISPLWKVPSCPRDFKRTSVERLFRNAGFAMDWCNFRLVEDVAPMRNNRPGTKERLLHPAEEENKWESVTRDGVPRRNYLDEMASAILVPVAAMLVLGLVLSFVLCFHHEGISDPASEDFIDNLYHICLDCLEGDEDRSKRLDHAPPDVIDQYATIHRATSTLRSLSNNRDMILSSPDALFRDGTSSPTTVGRGLHCRPSPPPYVRPKFKQPDL